MGIAQAGADVEAVAGALRGMYPKADENLKLKVETEFQLRTEQSPPDIAIVIMLIDAAWLKPVLLEYRPLGKEKAFDPALGDKD